MPFYTRKPVLIEARQLLPDSQNWQDLADWSNNSFWAELSREARFFLQTPTGKVEMFVFDWLIKGDTGNFSRCRNQLFSQIYEIVQEES